MPPNAVEVDKDFVEPQADVVSAMKKKTNKFSRAEVSRHHDRDDCYLIIRGKVYSVHDFISQHPGGEIIMTYAGDDATDVFAAFHPSSTYSDLTKFQIGELNDDEKEPSAFVRDARELRTIFRDQGLFKSSKLYYTFKVLFNCSMLASAVAILSYFPGSTPATILAACIVGLFWQQCGWLSHDFLHHQVFENRSLNNLGGFVLGNLFQGFSVDWWKNKHNTHHAVPNVHGGDPDIDTLPFLAWSEHALEGFSDPKAKESLPKFLIDHQFFFYTPLLTFARFSWLTQSALTVINKRATLKDYASEAFFLALHYVWFFAIIFFLCQGVGNKFLFLFVSQLSCGVLLAAVFSLNHNGMPVYSKEEAQSLDFYRLQILTGRAVTPSLFMTWFTGGLNYQIEHHLFPMIPRHNFHKIQPLVESLCKKHGVTYHRTGFISGTMEVFSRLGKIGNVARQL